MKTRFLIIIVLIALGSVVTLVMAETYRGQIDWKENVGGLVDEGRRIEIAPANDYGNSFPENNDYPFGLTGPEMSQQNCNDYVISQWQPTVDGREMVQQFLEICIQREFVTPELVERGKIADNFTMGPIQSARTSAGGDIEKTIEILEEMHREQTIENLKETHDDYVNSTVHVSVDKEDYHTDDVVIISGYVQGIMSNAELNITIHNPLMDAVFVSQVTISEDGTFTESLSIGGPLWEQNGIYSVFAQYGTATDRTDFLYLSDLELDDLL